MRNRTYGGVRGQKTKVGRKLLLRFLPTRLYTSLFSYAKSVVHETGVHCFVFWSIQT